MNERLYRSRDERMVAGVAGGLAHQFRMDPSLVRILWVILIPLTGGIALALYVVMAFVVPEEPAGDARWAAWEGQSGGYRWPDPSARTAPSTASGTTPPAGTVEPATTASGAAFTSGSLGSSSAGPSSSGPPSGWGLPPVAPTPGSGPAEAPGSTAPSPTTGWTGLSGTPRDARREARRAARSEGGNGSGAVLFGLILIVVGGYFFARAYLPDIDVNRAWPVLLVVLGAVLLIGAIRRGSNRPG